MAMTQDELVKKYSGLKISVDPNIKAWETRKGQAAAGFYKLAASFPKLTEKDNGELRGQVVFTVVEVLNGDKAQEGCVCFENLTYPNAKIHTDKSKRDAYEGKLKAHLSALRPDKAAALATATEIGPFNKAYYYADEKGTQSRTVLAHYHPYDSEVERDSAQLDYLTPEQWEEAKAGKLVIKKRDGRPGEDAAKGKGKGGDGSNGVSQKAKDLAAALNEDEATPQGNAGGAGAGFQAADDDL